MEAQDQDKNILEKVELVGKGHKDINIHIREVTLAWTIANVRAEARFFYLAYKNGEAVQDQFLEFIYSQIIPFCLERKYYKECFKKIFEDNDHQLMLKIGDEAKSLFINASKKNNKTGEPGEIVLFSLLEYVMGAPRVLSKMNLKTNRNMEVYGSDGIHMRYDPSDKNLYLYWGEAKLYKKLASSLTKILESVSGFTRKDSKGKSGRDYDVGLIERHADLGDTAAEEALLNYLNPYEKSNQNLREVHACLSVWDCDIYKEIEDEPPKNVEQIFKDRYTELLNKTLPELEKKIHNSSLTKLQFQFFLIPIKSVREFRKLFCEKVGTEFYEGDEDDL